MKRLLLVLGLVVVGATSAHAALVDGTNCGFVTTAPTADPAATAFGNVDNQARAGKFTAPATGTVTEIGWWVDNATEEANYECGLYTDDGGGATSVAVDLIDASRTNAKGTSGGLWKSCTVSIAITSGTIYWIAIQLDDTATQTNTNGATGGGRRGRDGAQTTLQATWGEDGAADNLVAFYAVYTEAGAARRIWLISEAMQAVEDWWSRT